VEGVTIGNISRVSQNSKRWGTYFISIASFLICLASLLSCSPVPQQPGDIDQGSTKRQEQQSERDSRVARLQVFPGDVMVMPNSSVIFAAVAYDAKNVPMGGVGATWRAYDANNREVPISQTGKFEPNQPGRYLVIAESAKHKSSVVVTVPKTPTEKRADPIPSATITRQRDGAGWDETNVDTAFDPINRRGRNPVYRRSALEHAQSK